MQDARHVVGIGQLQAAYGDAVTRRAWPELDAMFTADCPVRLDLGDDRVVDLVGSVQLGEFVAKAVERFELLVFSTLNSAIDVVPGGDEASARVYIRELRLERAGSRWTTAVGLYRDRYVREGDLWLFARRDYSTLARTGPDGAQVFPVPGM